ncbi:MAG: hypothetical protein H5T86_09220, partial [Armatimonadetes bacterium]|nr:hypothetical protein [Armatimonadota bacterium]
MRVGVVVNVAVEVLEHLPVQQMRDAGVWALFVRCYEGELRWRSPAVADFVHRARESRLRVFAVPAGYGCVLAPAQHPSSLFLQVHPDTRQVDSRGRRVPYACPNNPAYLEWVTSALRTLAWLIDADGFVWEEPGFFYSRGLWGCRCRWCQELYYGRGSGPMPSELEPQVAAFRQHSIASFVSALATAVRSVDSSLASLVAPTPAPQTGAVPTGNENWRLLATVEGVDGLILTWPPVASPTAPL